MIALLPGGGYAQYAKVHKDHTIDVPKDVELKLASGLTEVYATAFQILHLVAHAKAGETILVHAAASGVGTALLTLAKKAGLTTIAVASQDDKLEVCKSLGAAKVINYKNTPEFQEEVLLFTDGKGVDIVADPVGASNAARNVASLAKDGRWVLYGFLGGAAIENFDLRPLLMKRISLLVTALKSRSNDYKRDLLKQVGEAVFENETLQVKPFIDTTFPMSKASECHSYMEQNTSIGKALLEVDL